MLGACDTPHMADVLPLFFLELIFLLKNIYHLFGCTGLKLGHARNLWCTMWDFSYGV